jgi:DNA mismatch repair protein MutS
MNTPLMRQYSAMKAKYPETILLFRMGDFYETFEEDAKVAARVLGITLTKRGSGGANETPLAGFPHHALDAYLPKLLKAGLRVAVCEQTEDPKLAKGLVKRDVVEVVSPGVAFSDKVLEQKQNNYLCAVCLPTALAAGDDLIGAAYIDVTTAEFIVSEFPLRQLADQIAAFAPAELLVQKRDLETVKELLKARVNPLYSKLDDWVFNYNYGYELLINQFKTQTLKGFGLEEYTVGVIAAGAVMNYLQETQKARLSHIRKIAPYNPSEYITLDQSTKKNLEITRSFDGTEAGTLFWVLDRTRTPMGGRLLKKWINQPLRRIEPINARMEAVAELHSRRALRNRISETLGNIGDLERLVAKICTGRANPREMLALRMMLEHTGEIKKTLASPPADSKEKPKLCSATLAKLTEGLNPLAEAAAVIGRAIADDPPLSLADGGVIRERFNQELDELRGLMLNGKTWIANLQKTERERTGISSLKIGFNNVFGYFIEITNTHKDRVPQSYIRKQTMTNAERYITPELKEYEEKILHAEEKTLALETDLFNQLRIQVAENAEAIQQNARLIAMLDCFTSLAEVAVEYEYVRPVVDESTTIEITQGRHPVIERLLPPGDQYTANDVKLDNENNQILIITGPNMSGKSSYLRMVGLIALLTQIGSFVPAKAAHIGIVDRIYTRVGANDNIASGESTFLVEMHEAANIVNTASLKSLILLDEVGRGTSTFDGISIAWALTEYLHERIGAKTLFATHYHELNELADLFPRIKNLKVEVREYGDKVLFLHKVTPGHADHSYGIQVAQMAGLPEEVTERAKKILRNLEDSELILHDEKGPKGDTRRKQPRITLDDMQMTMFQVKDDLLRAELDKLDIEKMTPIEALQKLAELKKRL